MNLMKKRQKNINLKVHKITMKKLKKQVKGITLIALVVTIIVLLILAGVTIATLTGDNGILTRAQEAKNKTEIASEKEQNEMNDMAVTIDKATGNYKADRSKLKVGDFVNYVPNVVTSNYMQLTAETTGSEENSTNGIEQETLQWQILSINDDGTVDLVSSMPTNASVNFYGALGYNNSVYLLNDVCEYLYSNDSLNAKARSINIDDVEKGMNTNGIESKLSYTNSQGFTYGDEYTHSISGYSFYPLLYEKEIGSGINTNVTKKEEDGGIKQSNPYYNEPTTDRYSQASINMLTATMTFYQLTNVQNLLFTNEAFYNLIFGSNKNYFLASRYVNLSNTVASFGIRGIFDSPTNGLTISGVTLYSSSNYQYTSSSPHPLRPVVTINSNINFIDDNDDEIWELNR